MRSHWRVTLRPPEVRHSAEYTRYPQANFNIPQHVFLRFGTFISRFAKLPWTNIVMSYRVEHFRNGKMLLSFQLESNEFNCLGQFEILAMSEQLMERNGRPCSDLVRMLGPDGREIASWSSARRISCVRALPPPCAKLAANQKAADMDANEFVNAWYCRCRERLSERCEEGTLCRIFTPRASLPPPCLKSG